MSPSNEDVDYKNGLVPKIGFSLLAQKVMTRIDSDLTTEFSLKT